MNVELKFGTVLTGGQRINDRNNVNPTYKCPIQLENDETVGFVKDIRGREVLVEVFCALLGRSLGLPIPQPLLVLVNPGALPFVSDKPIVTFASEDIGHPSFARKFVNGPEDMTQLVKLFQYPHTLSVAAFDEWIINPDRHISNILYDGSDFFWFIDHGLALREGVSPDEHQIMNRLLDAYKSISKYLERLTTAENFKKSEFQKFGSIPLVSLLDLCHSDEMVGKEAKNRLNSFLSSRLASLYLSVSKKLDLPVLELNRG